MPIPFPLSRRATFPFLFAALLAMPAGADAAPDPGAGVFGDFLAARFAVGQSDPAAAADAYLRVLAHGSAPSEMLRDAFLAGALSGRAEATDLARRLPDDTLAQIWLAGADLRAGNWPGVEARARAMGEGSLALVLRPLLLAWSEQALGRTDAALGILGPLTGDGPFHAVFALHAGLIADLANRAQDAAGAFAEAERGFPVPGLRLAQVVASFDARHGRPGEAMGVLARAGRLGARNRHGAAGAGERTRAPGRDPRLRGNRRGAHRRCRLDAVAG